MTDRALLELAAKAVGIKAQWDCPERGMMVLTPDGIDTMTWNPLTDDGDALRLSVQLKMTIHIDNSMTEIVSIADHSETEAHLGDPYAATRRAITRAAAEIGRVPK